MSEIFLQIINMSISASYIVLAVLLLRLLLRKAPKWITVVLWGIVALRLVCPFSIVSVLSLIPSAEVVSPNIMTDKIPEINTGIPIINSTLNPVIGGSFTPAPGASVNPLQVWIPVLAVIWIVGMTALLVYTVISYAKVRRKIGAAVLLRDNIYQSEKVVSPFVLGIIKPKIYLPFGMNDKDTEHVVAHEMAHIRRKDHLWKPLGFLLLTIHWFNPLMWLGYLLLCRDIELACDEKVVGKLDRDARADYSEALLTCSVNRRMIAACPLAFGEVGVKDRVKSVLNYKKPAFWIIIAAVIACVAVAVCFLTNPPSDDTNNFVTPNGVNYTDYEGVYLTVKSIDTSEDGHKVFNLVWHNDTDKEVIFGESYFIERKVGNKWINTASEDLIFTAIGLLLPPSSTVYKSYSTQRFDISESGSYRLRASFSVDKGDGDRRYTEYNTWVEFTIGTTDSLREKYPDYFGLDASDGLDVYVWQMAENSYSFGLLPHAEDERSWLATELMNLRGARAEEMKVILTTYNISENDLYIIPWQNPLSSYTGWQVTVEGEDYNAKKQAYIERIRQMLFSSILLVEFTNVYDTATFDIDDDGVDEVCTMSVGPTSGLFTFIFSVRELGAAEDEYYTVNYSKWYDLSFIKGSDGVMRVQGITQGENPETHLFDISIKDGHVYLSENGVYIGNIQ